jgi:hypothetical protein
MWVAKGPFVGYEDYTVHYNVYTAPGNSGSGVMGGNRAYGKVYAIHDSHADGPATGSKISGRRYDLINHIMNQNRSLKEVPVTASVQYLMYMGDANSIPTPNFAPSFHPVAAVTSASLPLPPCTTGCPERHAYDAFWVDTLGNNPPHVFYQSGDSLLVRNDVQDLGARTFGGVAAVWIKPAVDASEPILQVFITNANGQVYTRRTKPYVRGGVTYDDLWSSIGGPAEQRAVTRPTVVAATGKFHVFAVGEDGKVWYAEVPALNYSKATTTWTAIEGNTALPVSAVMSGAHTLDVFFRACDGSIWYKRRQYSDWGVIRAGQFVVSRWAWNKLSLTGGNFDPKAICHRRANRCLCARTMAAPART